ncbi:MAG: DUF2628 domain-containing protein [Proteobacteria bacterium]|nr:DUF2628 domain-containing protein [Pseudomonadota bacterium]MDA1057806.1 DUF2628 domain-containing protein [Pseudomonadota bacterium]
MRVYSVYQSPTAGGDDDLIFIKDGFCWPALVLPLIWPLWRGLWLVALVVVGILVAVSTVVEAGLLAPLTGTVIEVAVALILGFEGNNLRRWVKSRRGWREVATVSGRRLDDAERSFFSAIEVTSTGALLPRTGEAL